MHVSNQFCHSSIPHLDQRPQKAALQVTLIVLSLLALTIAICALIVVTNDIHKVRALNFLKPLGKMGNALLFVGCLAISVISVVLLKSSFAREKKREASLEETDSDEYLNASIESIVEKEVQISNDFITSQPPPIGLPFNVEESDEDEPLPKIPEQLIVKPNVFRRPSSITTDSEGGIEFMVIGKEEESTSSDESQ